MPSTSTSLARTMLHGLRTSCCGVCSLHHACREAVSENNAVQSKYQNDEVDQFYFQDIDQIKGKKKKSSQNENESDPVEKKNLHEKKHLHEKQNLHENRYASEEQNIAEHSQKLEHLLELSLGAMLIVSELKVEIVHMMVQLKCYIENHTKDLASVTTISTLARIARSVSTCR